MAQKNLYYQAAFSRQATVRNFFMILVTMLSSSPRMLIEVFISTDFGERYFRLPKAITLTILLMLWPWLKTEVFYFLRRGGVEWGDYITWYIFTAAFLVFSVKHHLDQQRNPSVFDFARFSKSTGKINPVFRKFEIPWRKTDTRFVEIWVEPAAFFVAGVLLFAIGQALGMLLMVCAVIYGISYAYAYQWGDDFVMDKIDEMIVNKNLKASFVDDAPQEETEGFHHRGRKPVKPEDRQKLLLPMTGQTEKLTAE